LPVVASFGTETVMLDAVQIVTVAGVPLNVTVLVPCVEPKFAPVIVTDVPYHPEESEVLSITGVVITL
jgi:hypothetical protein